MTGALAALFTTAISLSGASRILFFFPLCLGIAIVYKTLRCESLRELPLSTVILFVTIILGMYAVAVGLWALFSLLA